MVWKTLIMMAPVRVRHPYGAARGSCFSSLTGRGTGCPER